MATPEQEYLDRARRVEDVVNRKSFGIADLPMKRDLVGETITRGLELALGMPEAKAAAPLVPTRPASAAPAASTGMPAAKAHPADGFKDVYDYAASLKPEAFKAFMKKNEGNPHLKGMGYVEIGDRIIPTISRPDEQGFGLGRDLTIGELEAVAPIINAGQANDLRRQHLDQLRVANEMALQEKREGRKDTLAQREEENFDKNVVNVYGKTAMGDINPAKGLFLAAVNNEKIPAARQSAAQKLAAPYLSHIQNLEKKYGRAIPEAQKKTILENYMKATFGE